MSLYKTGDSVAVHSVCGTLPRETIAIGVVAAAGSDLIELQDGQCVTDSNCIEPVTDEHQATIPTDSVQPTPDTCPPWRMHPNRKRPKPFLPYGFTSYDFDGFMAWIKQSFPSVYERMGKCENNSSGIERLLGVLIEELRTADSSKCLQSLRIIHECVTAIHPDLFNNLATELQGSVLIAVADCLQNDDRIVRRQAVGTLALFLPVWDREVLNALIGNGITNEDSETAVHSIELLHGIEPNLGSFAVPALITALSNSNDEVCRTAGCALEGMGNDALHAEQALIQIVLSNRNDETRFAALRVLLAVAGLERVAEMPKGDKPLSESDVEAIKIWISQGAKWPSELTLHEPKRNAGAWWAIQPLNRPEIPKTKNPRWPRNPIDAFILAKLEEKSLSPSPEADRRILVRRLSFDLLGLPPSPQEIQAFLDDTHPDAYERLVDRLLASPRYGERWARHWLDVVHYGDTHGYDKDKKRPNAWRYRDYVIKALNDDKSYAQFIREQIAGDVIDPSNPDALVATGFLAAGPWDFVGHVELREGTVEKEKTRLLDRDDILSNAIETFDSVTVHCARCHDHKFDPIPQRDYYRLQAVFAGIDRGDRAIESVDRAAKRFALQERKSAVAVRESALKNRILAARTPEMLRLDETIARLKTELAAQPSDVTTPSPSNGYHSAIHPRPDALARVQVDLGKSYPIDEIRLFPARPTDFPDTPGFGFPHRYQVEIADDPSFAHATVVSTDETPDDEPLLDEPIVIRPDGRSARFVRISASRLWKRTKDYVFALAELEVISGKSNVALGKRVNALDSIDAGLWSKKALVDGFSSRKKRPAADDPAEVRRVEIVLRLENALRERRSLPAAHIYLTFNPRPRRFSARRQTSSEAKPLCRRSTRFLAPCRMPRGRFTF